MSSVFGNFLTNYNFLYRYKQYYYSKPKTILIGFYQKYFNENIIDNYNIERIVTNKDIAKRIGDNISIKYIKCGCISSIIAKEFLNNNIIPSKQSVILLYYGMIFCPVNCELLLYIFFIYDII